jgi:hypothetical protein
MKTLHYYIIVVGIVASVMLVIFLMNISPSPKLTENMKAPMNFCSNPEYVTNGSSIFLICHHPVNSTDNVFNLPDPQYKFTGCGQCANGIAYVSQARANLLSDIQKQLVDKALQVTNLKMKYPDIQLDQFLIQPRADHWIADVQFVIPHIMNGYGHCGWYTGAVVDLNNLQVVPNGVPIGSQRC